MEVTAKAKYIHIAPRKVRLVVDAISGMDVVEAENQLEHITKRAKTPVLKLLKSAVANAEHNFDMVKDNLYIAKIQVTEGPTLMRFRARAFGRSAPIRKRTSHITIVLNEKVKGLKRKKKPKEEKKKVEIPKKEKIEVKKEAKEKVKPTTGYWQRKREEKKKGFFGRLTGAGRRVFRRKTGA